MVSSYSVSSNELMSGNSSICLHRARATECGSGMWLWGIFTLGGPLPVEMLPWNKKISNYQKWISTMEKYRLCSANFFVCISNEFHRLDVFCEPCTYNHDGWFSFHPYSNELFQHCRSFLSEMLRARVKLLSTTRIRQGPKYSRICRIDTLPFSFTSCIYRKRQLFCRNFNKNIYFSCKCIRNIKKLTFIVVRNNEFSVLKMLPSARQNGTSNYVHFKNVASN